MRISFFTLGVLVAMATMSTCEAQIPMVEPHDWPWWRGPHSNGIADDGQQPPEQWTATKNVNWKIDIPGRGHSSPIVIGNRIVMATADEKTKTQSIICIDRKRAAQIWKRDVNQGGFPQRINRRNTHASSTVAWDGTRLIALFLHHDAIQVVALDLNGKLLWQQTAGTFTPNQYKNGYAASPFLYSDNVMIAGDFDGKAFLTALDRATGKTVWKTPRPSRINYASPVVARVAGRDQLLLSGCDIVAGYDPKSGKQLWKSKATTMATAGTMVWAGDLVFASGGYPDAETVCIRADGSGEVIWRNRQKCYEQSMLAFDGHIYAMNDTGIAFCWNAKTGKEMWRERLRGPISASPVLANGNIYLTNELGTTWVFRATPKEFDLVAKNQLGTQSFASPAICGNQIFLRVAESVGGRRQERLYCLQAVGAD